MYDFAGSFCTPSWSVAFSMSDSLELRSRRMCGANGSIRFSTDRHMSMNDSTCSVPWRSM